MTVNHTVWLLYQLRRETECDLNSIRGAFPTESAAMDASHALPNEEDVTIEVLEYDLDKTMWLEGFVTEWRLD